MGNIRQSQCRLDSRVLMFLKAAGCGSTFGHQLVRTRVAVAEVQSAVIFLIGVVSVNSKLGNAMVSISENV
jgi:hypothetical protein